MRACLRTHLLMPHPTACTYAPPTPRASPAPLVPPVLGSLPLLRCQRPKVPPSPCHGHPATLPQLPLWCRHTHPLPVTLPRGHPAIIATMVPSHSPSPCHPAMRPPCHAAILPRCRPPSCAGAAAAAPTAGAPLCNQGEGMRRGVGRRGGWGKGRAARTPPTLVLLPLVLVRKQPPGRRRVACPSLRGPLVPAQPTRQ